MNTLPSSRNGTTVLQPHQIDKILDQPIYGAEQVELGSVARVYLDGVTGQPAWAAVRTGTQESFIPLGEATMTSERLTVPYDKDTVSAAPAVVAQEGHLPMPEATELHRHYGLPPIENRPETDPSMDEPKTADRSAPVSAQGG